MKLRIVLVLLCCSVFAFCNVSNRITVGQRDSAPYGWEVVRQAHPKERVSFSLLLKQSNLDVLNEVFESVSNPKSNKWGQFLTAAEIQKLVSPSQDVIDEFLTWLNPISSFSQIEVKGDYISVTTNVVGVSKLFLVPFYVFENKMLGKSVIKYVGEATVPAHLADKLDFVAGLSEFWSYDVEKRISNDVANINIQSYRNAAPKKLKDDIIITPSVLKNYYNVPQGAVGTNPNNMQGIAAFTDYFSLGALRQFDQDQNIPVPNVKRIGPDCFPSCDQYESDLDIQYITSMGQGVPTIFLNQPANYWILQFAQDTLNMVTAPMVFSVSYGWSELEQCQVATYNCAVLGYNSQQYVNRTNTELQKLGTMGVSVLVSDGDDGSVNLGGASGNCPIDDNNYCPTGGCQYTSTQCGGITIVNTTSGLQCFFPMGLGSDACSGFLNDQNAGNALQALFNANSGCGLTLDYDYSQMPHVYASCSCSSLTPVTAYGYAMSGYTYSASNGPLFVADYPTSSPYVTSVGATQFLSSGSNIQEVVCSILTGAIITTGGGFSAFQPMPSYQQQAVSQYLTQHASSLPPTGSFNPNMRAYPDIAFNGHHYKIFYSNDTSDNCPCLATEVDGTSCSAPALSGLISLINDKLLNNGKSQLGFLNYLLYQMYQAQPNAFHDITSGNNNCNRAYCCIYGYSAVPGYDAASGLGSPNYTNMLNYILAAKGVQTN